MICQNCGHSNDVGVKYCVNCGSKLEFVNATEAGFEENEEQPMTENVSGNESVYRNVVENMSDVYAHSDEAEYDTTIYYNNGKKYNESYTLGLLSMILAIVGFFSCGCCSCLQMPLELAAIVLGVISLVSHERLKGFAITGLTLGVVLILFSCISRILGAIPSPTYYMNYNNSYNMGRTLDDMLDGIGDIVDYIDDAF